MRLEAGNIAKRSRDQWMPIPEETPPDLQRPVEERSGFGVAGRMPLPEIGDVDQRLSHARFVRRRGPHEDGQRPTKLLPGLRQPAPPLQDGPDRQVTQAGQRVRRSSTPLAHLEGSAVRILGAPEITEGNRQVTDVM